MLSFLYGPTLTSIHDIGKPPILLPGKFHGQRSLVSMGTKSWVWLKRQHAQGLSSLEQMLLKGFSNSYKDHRCNFFKRGSFFSLFPHPHSGSPKKIHQDPNGPDFQRNSHLSYTARKEMFWGSRSEIALTEKQFVWLSDGGNLCRSVQWLTFPSWLAFKKRIININESRLLTGGGRLSALC